MYRSRYSRQNIQRLAISIINPGVKSYNLDFITDILKGKILFGSYLKGNIVTEQQGYTVNCKKICLSKNANIYQELTFMLFNEHYDGSLD